VECNTWQRSACAGSRRRSPARARARAGPSRRSGAIDVFGLDFERHERQVKRLINRVSVDAAFFKRLSPMENMSRGMQQKVAIARALLTAPTLLLLDEPTTGLDPRSKKDVQRFVLELRETHDATVLLTSHDMDEADELCDRLAILDRGKIVVEGTPLELKERHAESHGLDTLPSLEDVFMDVTGRSLEDADIGDEDE
jgi:ABC-2 type transport system ATP-binding protein